MKLKYVVMCGEFGSEEMVIFSETMKHSHICRKAQVISAGFIQVRNKSGDIDPEAYGESVSLRVGSRPEEDTKLAKELFNVA